MKQNNWTPTQLFFSHAHEVLKQIKEKYPHIKLIMWDDMFREAETVQLESESTFSYYLGTTSFVGAFSELPHQPL